MITLSSVPSGPDPGLPPGRNPSAQKRGSIDPYGEGSAFSILLDTVRSIQVVSNRIAGSNSTSPIQMFESPPSDSHEYRQSVMQQQDRAESLNGSQYRQDPTSVRARLADQNQQQTEMDQRLHDPRVNSSGSKLNDPTSPNQGERRFVGDEFSKTDMLEQKNRLAPFTSHPPAHRSEMRTDAGSTSSVKLQNMTGTTGQVSASSPASAVQSASAGQTRQHTIARQVGQILSAGRGDEAESARANKGMAKIIFAAPPAADARLSSSHHHATTKTLAKPAQDAKSSTQVEKQSDPASRPLFDQLVRSIRLRPGLWQSSARLRLDPPSLGKINVDVRLVGKKLEIDVRTETAEATERLLHQASRLKTALEQHGIYIERFDVSMETTQHQTDGESDAPLTDASTPQYRESMDMDTHGNVSGEVSELSDPSIENLDEMELNTAAERRLDVKA